MTYVITLIFTPFHNSTFNKSCRPLIDYQKSSFIMILLYSSLIVYIMADTASDVTVTFNNLPVIAGDLTMILFNS